MSVFLPYTIKKILAIELLLLGLQTARAQQIILRGAVVDGITLEALSGVHIYLNKQKGTASDIEGNFQITVRHLDTLHFTRVGYHKLSMVINDQEESQQMIVTMRQGTALLKPAEVESYFQAQTLIKQPEKQSQSMRIPGVRYSENMKKNYHLGVYGAVLSPVTAIYRMFSKRYKEEKRNYLEQQQRQKEAENFERAGEKIRQALQDVGVDLDDYYYRDFIYYMGKSVEDIAESRVYDLVKMLPQAVESYQKHTKKSQQNEVE